MAVTIKEDLRNRIDYQCDEGIDEFGLWRERGREGERFIHIRT